MRIIIIDALADFTEHIAVCLRVQSTCSGCGDIRRSLKAINGLRAMQRCKICRDIVPDCICSHQSLVPGRRFSGGNGENCCLICVVGSIIIPDGIFIELHGDRGSIVQIGFLAGILADLGATDHIGSVHIGRRDEIKVTISIRENPIHAGGNRSSLAGTGQRINSRVVDLNVIQFCSGIIHVACSICHNLILLPLFLLSLRAGQYKKS